MMKKLFTLLVTTLISTSWLTAQESGSYLFCEPSCSEKERPLSIQLPVFRNSNWVCPLSSEEIVTIVRPILRSRLAAVNYDRVQASLQFLNHFKNLRENSPALSPLEATCSLSYEISPEKSGGAQCVGLTLDLYTHLPEKCRGIVIASILPKKYQQFAAPIYCHTAVLIPFHNRALNEKGYILLDPSFDFSEPIVLIKGGSSYQYNFGNKGIWEFTIAGDQIICSIHSLLKSNPNDPLFGQMVYRTDEFLNPIQASAVPMLIADRRLSLLSRREDGFHISHINIELDKKRVVWDVDEELLPPIPFEKILDGSWQFDADFAWGLNMSPEYLNSSVMQILQEQYLLDALYLDFLYWLYNTRDFRLTGPLDPEQILRVIENTKKDNS